MQKLHPKKTPRGTSVYITRVNLKQTDPETVKKALEWCSYCQTRDPTFNYTQKGNFIIITSPTKQQAYKRGSALHKRFTLHFNVEKQTEKEEK